jgi:hypothetical protein
VDGTDIALGIMAAGVAKEAPKLGAELLRDLFGPGFKAAGEGMAVGLKTWKAKRELRMGKILDETARQLKASGDTPKVVPERMLVPLLEKASLVEEEELQHVWASLLANMARNPEGVLPAFVSILGELSPTEVRLLASWSKGSGDVTELSNFHHTNQESLTLVVNVSELRLVLANLERLLLIVPSQHASEFDKHGDDSVMGQFVRVTRFGARFILACSEKRNG